ncbi:hypothetical protein Plhal710r2_c005g0022081 [Plasmopara halstedii]
MCQIRTRSVTATTLVGEHHDLPTKMIKIVRHSDCTVLGGSLSLMVFGPGEDL